MGVIGKMVIINFIDTFTIHWKEHFVFNFTLEPNEYNIF